MTFKINKIDNENRIKSIRFSKDLEKKIMNISNRNKISFSKFVIEACLYALDNLEEDNTKEINKSKEVKYM